MSECAEQKLICSKQGLNKVHSSSSKTWNRLLWITTITLFSPTVCPAALWIRTYVTNSTWIPWSWTMKKSCTQINRTVQRPTPMLSPSPDQPPSPTTTQPWSRFFCLSTPLSGQAGVRVSEGRSTTSKLAARRSASVSRDLRFLTSSHSYSFQKKFPACLPQYWLLTVAAKEKITSPVSILAQTKILINIVWLSVQVTNHILHHIMLRMESGSSCICQHACTQDSLVWLMWCSSRCAMCINHGTLGMCISKRRFLTCYWVYLTSHRQCLWTSLKSLLKNLGKKSLDQLK